jgi:hypothetical protein
VEQSQAAVAAISSPQQAGLFGRHVSQRNGLAGMPAGRLGTRQLQEGIDQATHVVGSLADALNLPPFCAVRVRRAASNSPDVPMIISGVRNSWLTSLVNKRSRSTAARNWSIA